jgi:hypothetical protein
MPGCGTTGGPSGGVSGGVGGSRIRSPGPGLGRGGNHGMIGGSVGHHGGGGKSGQSATAQPYFFLRALRSFAM